MNSQKLDSLFIILLLIVGCQSNAGKKIINNDLDRIALKGAVKKIRYFDFNVQLNSNELKKGKLKEIFVAVYNRDGFMTEGNSFTENEKFDGGQRYKYDESNMAIEKLYLRNDSSMESKRILTYNKNELLESETLIMANGDLLSKETYIYDYKNKLSRINKTVGSHSLFNNEISYKNVSKSFEYSKNKNNNTNIETTKDYDENNNLVLTTIRTLDEFDNEIEWRAIEKDGSSQFNTMSYDQNGNKITESEFNASHIQIKQTVFKYNDKQLLIRKEETNLSTNEKEVLEYEYKYDDKNNCIQRIERKNDKPTEISERVIEYY